MATIAFDTLKFSNRLKAAGVPDKQAEAEAEALKEVLSDFAAERLDDLATRRDLKELELALQHNAKELEVSARRDLKEAELRLEAKMADSKADLIRWVVSAGIVQTAVIGALVMSLAKGG
jgi:hypothetical protein